MLHCFSVSFPSCQICSSHSNCHVCAARWQEDLSALSPIEQITVTTAPLTMEIQSPLDSDSLIDLLEDRGIFVQD